MTVTAGQVWERVRPPIASPRAYGGGPEKIGDRIEIEETPLSQQMGHAPDQARAVFVSGARNGEKVQWAIAYIEDAFRLDG